MGPKDEPRSNQATWSLRGSFVRPEIQPAARSQQESRQRSTNVRSTSSGRIREKAGALKSSANMRLGSARVSPAGNGVSPLRTFAVSGRRIVWNDRKAQPAPLTLQVSSVRVDPPPKTPT